MDLATEAPVVDKTPPVSTTSDSSTPRERVSVRETIQRSFADARQQDERQDREAPTSREPEEKEEDTDKDVSASTTDADSDTDRSSETDTETETDSDKSEDKAETAPTSWTKDAKSEWENLPDKVRKEVLKREKDVEKGVKSLKDKYKEVDDAIAPYLPVIQQFGKSPGQAVGQLFAWFDALAKNPDEAFPALLDSYKYHPVRAVAPYVNRDPVGFVNAMAQMYQTTPQQLLQNLWQRINPQQPKPQQQQNGQVQNGQDQPIHPQVQQYIQQLQQELGNLKSQVTQHDQHFGGLANYYEQQNAAKTQEMLERWASDKPHFERVRMKMGYLLTPDPNTGQAAIPLKDGKVDLDEAYNQAIWMDPEIRQATLAEQEAQKAAARKAKQDAALKAQQEQADKARRASGSLTTSAPGAEVSRKTSPAKGMSVRDSLKQAISDLSSR